MKDGHEISSITLEELKQGLLIPSAGARLMTLERLFSPPHPPGAHGVLVNHLRTETDEECRFFAHLFLDSHTPAAPPSAPVTNPISPTASLKDLYREASRDRRFEILRGLPVPPQPQLAEDLVSLLRDETFPPLAVALVRSIGKLLPQADPHPLMEFLHARLFSVRLAALETLCQLSPRQLIEALPPFLDSPDLGLRVLAIEGLFAIDADEAVRHLEGTLLGPDPQARDFLIQACLHLPFPLVKNSVLKALRLERDPSRRDRLGLLIKTNPDPEIPFHLWLIVEESSGEDITFFRDLLDASLSVIEASTLLGNRFQEYRSKLQTWVGKRLAAVLRARLAAAWSLSGDRDEVRLHRFARRAWEHPMLGETFITSSKEFWPPELYEWVLAQRPSKTESQATESSVEGFLVLPPADQIRILANWPPERGTELHPLLAHLLRTPWDYGVETAAERSAPSADSDRREKLPPASPEVKAALLRAAARCKCEGFIDLCKALLADPPSQISVAALEYASVFAPGFAMTQLGRFLRASSRRLKIQAIQLLRRFDVVEVVERLRAMLGQRDKKLQEACLECMFHLEFSVVRELLAEFLQRCTDQKLFQTGLMLFQCNPDPDNLVFLTTIAASQPTGRRKEIDHIRQSCQELLVASGLWNSAQLDEYQKTIEDKAAKHLRRASHPQPAYAFRPKPVGISWADRFQDLKDYAATQRTAIKWATAGLSIFLIAGLVGIWLFLPGSATPNSNRGRLLLARATKQMATVLRIEKDWIVLAVDGQDPPYFVRKEAFVAVGIKPQTRLELILEPYRIQAQGPVYCHAYEPRILTEKKEHP